MRRSEASEWPSESRMRENRPSGLMRGGCDGSDDDNYGLQSKLPHLPTLLNRNEAVGI